MAIETVAADNSLRAENRDLISGDVRTKNLQRTELAPMGTTLCHRHPDHICHSNGHRHRANLYVGAPRCDWDGNFEFFANISEGRWQAWFAQFTEHRIIIPRLFYWADLRFFGGHFLFQLLSGVAFAIALWAMFLLLAGALTAMRFLIGAMITL